LLIKWYTFALLCQVVRARKSGWNDNDHDLRVYEGSYELIDITVLESKD